MPDEGWNEIYRYTRQQAIADGMLTDVSGLAREAGFRFPVAVTNTVWAEIIVPDDDGKIAGQSEKGRLWDVLMCLRYAISKSNGNVDRLIFSVLVLRNGNVEKVKLRAICHPGDNGEPVLTIMYPNED